MTPQEITDAKNRVDILDIISGYISLKKHGKLYQGLCPLHEEKTPSFTVYTVSQRFHCFGCGQGGDVIEFLMEMEGLSFPDTVKRLKGEMVTATRTPRPAQKIILTPRDPKPEPSPQLIELYEKTYDMARKTLLEGLGRESEDVRTYLAGRGFKKEDLGRVDIGAYLPEHREVLVLEIDSKLLKESGLVRHGMAYNYQIVMPHRNKAGRVVGLTFRLFKEGTDYEGKPLSKYKHTPDLDKSYLYNLSEAAPYIRKEGSAVIVEGHLDVEGLKLMGYKNAVAAGGNQFNIEMLNYLIDAGAKNLHFGFDTDDRGKDGCSKAVQLVLFDNRINVFVVFWGKKFKDAGKIIESADRAEILMQCMKKLDSGARWLAKYLATCDNDLERQQAILDGKEIYTKIIKDKMQQHDFVKALSSGLKYKSDDIREVFTGVSQGKASGGGKKTARGWESEYSATELARHVSQMLQDGIDLYALKEFLEAYARQNKSAMRGERKTFYQIALHYCKGMQYNTLVNYVNSKVGSLSITN